MPRKPDTFIEFFGAKALVFIGQGDFQVEKGAEPVMPRPLFEQAVLSGEGGVFWEEGVPRLLWASKFPASANESPSNWL